MLSCLYSGKIYDLINRVNMPLLNEDQGQLGFIGAADGHCIVILGANLAGDIMLSLVVIYLD
jgi:hypothetical protein